jgi:hypothetical protein
VVRPGTDGKRVVRTGRVEFPGAPRIGVQARVAGAAIAALMEELKALRG